MKFRTILLTLATSIPLAQFTAGAQPTNAAAAGPIGPRIQFAEPVYDFGKVVSGTVVSHDFVFTNTGDATLEITSVVPGCHCTTAGDWSRHVAPGQTGIVPIRFDSKGFTGPITRRPTVVSNDRQNPTTSFQLTGTIWVPFVMTPGYVVFSFPQGSTTPATNIVHIVSSVPEPVTLSDPTTTTPGVTIVLSTIKAGSQFDLAVVAMPPAQPGVVQGSITIKTTATNSPTLTVPTMLIVPQPPVVKPLTPTNTVAQPAHLPAAQHG